MFLQMQSKMLKLVNAIILLQFQIVFIKCVIPGLSVRRLDSKLIERKRQDTLDMCRIFNEENDRMQYYPKSEMSQSKRFKRSPDNPTLNPQEKRRVEAMIDQLYDDLDGDTGSRQMNKVNTSRRFNFAPAELLGPLPTEEGDREQVPDYFGPSARFPLGIVPFFIDPKTYDSQLSERILDAFDYFEKATCVRLQKLRERPTDSESLKNVIWLYITNPSGIRQCVHSNERHLQNGVQMIVFGYDCMSLGDITHEVMHILGYSHEHTRTDRDQYVTILWDNIKPGYRKYFQIYDKNILESLPYDYASVLHYPSRAFSKNGQITIMSPPGAKIGQREGLSETDVEKVGTIYASECLQRNKDYLLKTCPSVIKADRKPVNVSQEDVENYFKDRLWPLGIVNVKIDLMEFSVEEKENIHAVMRHIEKETCIQFRDLAEVGDLEIDEDEMSPDPKESVPDTNKTKNKDAGSGKGVKFESDSSTEKMKGSKLNNNIDNKLPISEASNTTTDGTVEYIDIIIEQKKVMNDNEITDDALKTELKSEPKVLVKSGNYSSSGISTSNNLKAADRKTLLSKTLNEIQKGTRTRIVASEKHNLRAKPQTRRHASNILVLKRSPEPGCSCPQPGKPNGDKELQINGDCFNSVNDLLHLFVHVLGLDHQHNMHDRDSFLHIVWDNLTDDVRKDMREKLPPAASAGFAYDYQSVMHFPWLQIKNGTTNIMYPIWNDGWAMGRWQGLSSTDVKKLNIIYAKQCQDRIVHAKRDDDDNKKYYN